MPRSRLVVQPPSVGRFSVANDLQPFPVLGVVCVNRTLPLCTSMKPVAMMRALLLALGVVCATGGPTIAAVAPVRWLPTPKGPQRAERTSKDPGIQGNKYRNSSESWVQKPWVSGLFFERKTSPPGRKLRLRWLAPSMWTSLCRRRRWLSKIGMAMAQKNNDHSHSRHSHTYFGTSVL